MDTQFVFFCNPLNVDRVVFKDINTRLQKLQMLLTIYIGFVIISAASL